MLKKELRSIKLLVCFFFLSFFFCLLQIFETMRQETKPIHLTDDDIPRISHAIVGDIRQELSLNISKQDCTLITERLHLICNRTRHHDDHNPHDRINSMEILNNRRRTLEQLNNIPRNAAESGFFYNGMCINTRLLSLKFA